MSRAFIARLSQLQAKCQARTGRPYRLIVIHEAGLDGFWIHRTLENANIESHVVDPASIATSRRRRRVKTDGVYGAALVRALLAHKRGAHAFGGGRHGFDTALGGLAIMDVSWCQEQDEGPAFRIADSVELGVAAPLVRTISWLSRGKI